VLGVAEDIAGHTTTGFRNLSGLSSEIASGALSVPLYLLACYIVRRIWRDQSASFAQAQTASTAP
jgi:hypothetical protein